MQLSLRPADDIQDVLDAISEELNTGQFEQFTFEDPLLKVCLPVDRQIKCQHCPFAIILPGRNFTADWLMVQLGVVVQPCGSPCRGNLQEGVQGPLHLVWEEGYQRRRAPLSALSWG